ncbi:MAG: MarR family transcriptional regulator, partial [Bosea sp. (in: a-proteobacteria)]|nr:MarR family transcriptional regulator [Bosea sp. (in: a-proteobacteria)]
MQLRLERFLPYRLNVVGTLGGHALGRIYTEHFGIGIPEWRVVAQLGEFGKLTSRDIGELAQMHKTKVSRAVTELEKRGFVSRAENRQDRRESFVTLTPAGKRVYDQIVPLALGFEARWIEG